MANMQNYEKILKDNDLEFISFFTKNKRKFIEYECKKHGVLTGRFDKFIGCKKCNRENIKNHPSLATKDSVEDIRSFVKNNSNCEFMSNTYKNSKTYYWFRCGCGNGFKTNMYEFRHDNKRQCNQCGVKKRSDFRRGDFEYYNNIVKDFGKSKLLRVEHINKCAYLVLECTCGKEYTISASGFYRSPNKVCHSCSIKIRNIKNTLTPEYVVEYLESYGLKLLSEFKNTRTKIKVKCSCGKELKAKFNTIHNSTHKSCKDCAIEKQSEASAMSKEDFEQRFKKLNSDDYEILTEYNRKVDYIEVRHKICNGVYRIKPKSLKQSPTVCPHCNMTRGEDKIANYLRKNNISFIPQYRFNDCRNIHPLPFDFFLPDYNLCIEFDGEQHFKVVEHFGGLNSYLNRIKSDLIKNKYCRDNNIRLIRLPFYEFNKINKTLKYLLKI